MKERNRWRFLNLPISHKWLVAPAIWPIVAVGQNWILFSYSSLPFIEGPFSQYFFKMLPVFYQRKKNKIPDFFLCCTKKNISKTFAGQAWCPAVTDTSYYSVLNPKQSLINLNLLNWHHLSHIHPWKGVYYRL